MHKSPN